jgi:hypothetical protein
MDRGSHPVERVTLPLTEFLVALAKMTPDQRAKASAERAAERYGIRLDWAQHYINHWRRVWDDGEKTKKNPRQQRQRTRG